ncbi:MAG: AtpZ/AtpI family protein [Candidatus Omnitrophica bacterium]|nr:AtpZ/AtpI family protein [Candidatus Omnitrophota bacterium]
MDKKEFYNRVKIAGLISYIPFILLAAPLGGFFAGEFLHRRFNTPDYILLIFVAFGLLIGIKETIKIIKICIRSSQP